MWVGGDVTAHHQVVRSRQDRLPGSDGSLLILLRRARRSNARRNDEQLVSNQLPDRRSLLPGGDNSVTSCLGSLLRPMEDELFD